MYIYTYVYLFFWMSMCLWPRGFTCVFFRALLFSHSVILHMSLCYLHTICISLGGDGVSLTRKTRGTAGDAQGTVPWSTPPDSSLHMRPAPTC